MRKLVLLIAVLAAMLAACSQDSNVTSIKGNESKNVENENLNEISEEVSEEYERGYYRENDQKLDFNKEIQFVHVKEVNNHALHERPFGGIASQDILYYRDEDVLYFFYDAKLPTEDIELIISKEQFNHDYLLNQELHQSESNSETLTLESIDNEFVNNDNRLFLNDDVKISKIADEGILVELNNSSYEVKKNDTLEIPLEKGDIKSTIIIENFGLLNSIEDMTYQKIENEELLPKEDTLR